MPNYAIDSSPERHLPTVKFSSREEKVHLKHGQLLVWRINQVLDLTNSFGAKVTIDFAPTQPVVQHTGGIPNVPIALNVITGILPDKMETSEIWQDAGDGYGYKLNDWREIRIEHKRGLLRLNCFGDFQGQKIRYIEA